MAALAKSVLRPVLGQAKTDAVVSRTYSLLALVYYSLRAQYARAALGLLWSVLTPLFFMAVYLPLFTYAFKSPTPMPGGELSYPMFVIIGFIAWNAFTDAVYNGAGSLVHNPGVVRHSPTPSIMLPLVKVTTSFVGLAAGMLCLAVTLLFFGLWPSWSLLLLPVAVILSLVFTAGLVLLLSSVAMHLRDVLQMLNTVLLIEFFACPILYPITMIPERFRIYIELNPLTPFLNLVRAALLPVAQPLALKDIGLASAWAFGMLLVGYLVFKRLEPGFTDAT